MGKNIYVVIGTLLMLSLGACNKKSSDSPTPLSSNQFTDSRDNNVYSTVTIGAQVWMATNLKYNTASSLCPSGDCNVNGAYYTSLDAKTACPSGYHLPSDRDWQLLEYNQGMLGVDTAKKGMRGGVQQIGTKLSSGGSSGLNLNYYGWYSVFPTQLNLYASQGYYWTSTVSPAVGAGNVQKFHYTRFISDTSSSIGRIAQMDTLFYACVRCLKN
ncbi:MAG TPA: FISUMP domain-containing protein [Cytophagaceae bacterium]|jgi:uncharacterized protein (TIGR02145 family)|nr:FISUMP domain-containing protein [Cytophagaceae bacterium]